MEKTPKANRLHIGIFGRVNSGKSSLINAVTGQNTAMVSDIPGTTTDPVAKSMEIKGIGPVVFIDTAGFGDGSELGAKRMELTRRSMDKTDIAVIVIAGEDVSEELEWARKFRDKGVPVIAVINKADLIKDTDEISQRFESASGIKPVKASAITGSGIDEFIKALALAAGHAESNVTILGNLVSEGDVVMLVMPQDPQAPKGRLILPQAQTIRELLDRRCVMVGCTLEKMKESLDSLKNPPKLIITDSQVFRAVSEITPKESMLTSFSVLFANYKGDIKTFVEGASAIDRLTGNSRVLIAEACTHAPIGEDIGREKIPAMLRKRFGEELKVDVVSGPDFPDDLSSYDLIIHCGACMFNRRHVLSRIEQADGQGVPITNYGVTIAFLTGILDKVVYPG